MLLSTVAQNNEILAEGYLLKVENASAEAKFDIAENYLKKALKTLKNQPTNKFLITATLLYFKKKDFKETKKYADLYFLQQKDKKSPTYNKMLLLYVDIEENLLKKQKPKENDFIATVNKDYYQIATQLFKVEKHKEANKVIDKYFSKKPLKSSREYQDMLLLKVDVLDALEKIDKKRVTDKEVSFSVIEEVPVFPGCKGSKREKKNCLNKEIMKIVVKNFNADLANNLGLPGGECIRYAEDKNGKKYCAESIPRKYRIYIQFKIDLDGSITDIKVRAPHSKLKKEGVRIAKLIPKMTPGEQRGKPVRVGYTLPVTFNVE